MVDNQLGALEEHVRETQRSLGYWLDWFLKLGPEAFSALAGAGLDAFDEARDRTGSLLKWMGGGFVVVLGLSAITYAYSKGQSQRENRHL